jgi:creatinine amidohydrolase
MPPSTPRLPRPFWQEMTTEDFRAASAADWIAVLPIAAIEQHGPHLPTGTDRFINEGHIARVVDLLPDTGLPVTFLPIIAVGKSNEHISSPGTLTLTWETLTKVVLEIGASVTRAGIRKLVIVNSHGGNAALLEMIVRELRVAYDMLAVQTAWSRFPAPAGLYGEHEARFGIHGGEAETSIMLALRPDTVKMEKAEHFRSAQENFVQEFKHLRAHGGHPFGWKAQDLNPKGPVGDARLATPEKGRIALDNAARGFLELLDDVARFDPARLWRPAP